eukprot:666535-Prymnesium_polylepis.2
MGHMHHAAKCTPDALPTSAAHGRTLTHVPIGARPGIARALAERITASAAAHHSVVLICRERVGGRMSS